MTDTQLRWVDGMLNDYGHRDIETLRVVIAEGLTEAMATQIRAIAEWVGRQDIPDAASWEKFILTADLADMPAWDDTDTGEKEYAEDFND